MRKCSLHTHLKTLLNTNREDQRICFFVDISSSSSMDNCKRLQNKKRSTFNNAEERKDMCNAHLCLMVSVSSSCFHTSCPILPFIYRENGSGENNNANTRSYHAPPSLTRRSEVRLQTHPRKSFFFSGRETHIFMYSGPDQSPLPARAHFGSVLFGYPTPPPHSTHMCGDQACCLAQKKPLRTAGART